MSNFSPVLRKVVSLILVLGGLGFAGYLLWLAWPQILLHSIKWQREINGELSDLLYDAKENNLTAGLYLVGLSFLYGVLHSVGPGHGKIIVTTFLATHPAKIKHGLILTCLSALMQAIVAVALVSALVVIFNHSMRDVNSKADYFISASFLAMSALGVTIIWRTSKALYQYLIKGSIYGSSDHHHGVSADEVNRADSWKSYPGIIFSIGIRPCTGAIMVLLFSHMTDMYWLGIVSAILMAVGTAITTSTIALLTVSGKKIIQRYLSSENHHHNVLGKVGLQFAGGVFLLLLGIAMFSSRTQSISPMLL